MLADISSSIRAADALLQKYDPRSHVSQQKGKSPVTTPSNDSLSHSAYGLLNLTVESVTKRKNSDAGEVQSKGTFWTKLKWTRSAKKELHEQLKQITRSRERLRDISGELERMLDNNRPSASACSSSTLAKPVVAAAAASASQQSPCSSQERTHISDSSEKVRRAAKSIQKTILLPTHINLDMMLLKNRRSTPQQALCLSIAKRLSAESIKFPVYVHDQKGRIVEFALIESLETTVPLKVDSMVCSSAPGKYQVKVFADESCQHVMHTIRISADAFPSQFSLSNLLELPAELEHHILFMWKRLELAHLLAVSILQLHDTDWLRENLSSDNIFFHGPSNRCLSEKVSLFPIVSAHPDDSRASQKEVDDFRRISLESMYDQDPTRQLVGNPFFDRLIHDLGIVLLEIGTGKPLRDIITSLNGMPCSGRELKKELQRLVDNVNLGRPYKQLVVSCLNMEFGFQGSGGDPERAFFDKIVSRLEGLEKMASELAVGERSPFG